MGIVKAQLSMSLDGYIAGPNAGPGNPLGDGGERVHEWVYGLASWREPQGLEGGERNRDSELLAQANSSIGATIMGRRMFDTSEEPWGDDPPFHTPVFVLTSVPREPLARAGGTTFTFVTDGLDRAMELARAAADDQNISVAGGADTVRRFLVAGLLDELQIHVSPFFLGTGIQLFDGPGLGPVQLEPVRVEGSARVAHLHYRAIR